MIFVCKKHFCFNWTKISTSILSISIDWHILAKLFFTKISHEWLNKTWVVCRSLSTILI